MPLGDMPAETKHSKPASTAIGIWKLTGYFHDVLNFQSISTHYVRNYKMG